MKRIDMFSRIDYFIVWKNGFDFIYEILDLINKNNFEIFHIKKIKTSNLRSFLKNVYSHDYAPYLHIKGKLKYLYRIKNDFVYLISVFNKSPNEFLQLNKVESHIESKSMNTLKKIIREKYNPRDKNGKLTQNHVIHGTDNKNQAFFLLKKYNIEIPNIESVDKIWPTHLKNNESLSLKRIKTNLLKANIINKNKQERIDLTETPHYKFLLNDKVYYHNYLIEHLGEKLLKYYSPNKFSSLLEKIKKGIHTHPIIINENNQILDGLHRASIYKFLDIKNIPVLITQNE